MEPWRWGLIEALDIPSGGALVLESGGYHMMLIDVERLRPGDEVDVTLVWENGGEGTIAAEVIDPADILEE
ncbi:MAG TPA: copper chaperone PCu(A)C [Acidimicrobiia bacterium]